MAGNETAIRLMVGMRGASVRRRGITDRRKQLFPAASMLKCGQTAIFP
jgi:hypothetical protein